MRRKRKLSGKGEKADTKESIWSLLFFFCLNISAFINLSKLYDHKDIYINVIFSYFFIGV